MEPTGEWRVQVGKGSSRYTDKWTFPADSTGRAMLYYHSLNTHSGHKKRLIDPHGRVMDRVLT